MNRFCPDMQDRIVDYMLGALDGPQARAVQDHLAGCEGCRRHLDDLKRQGDALAELGGRIAVDANARQEKVVQALREVAPATRIAPILNHLARIAAAAVLILGVGIVIGRMTAPKPVDVERLRADLEASIVASLKPAVQKSVLAGLDERLATALASNDANLQAEAAVQIRRELESFASNSEDRMDRRFAELIDAIEADRLTDRRQVARALEQIKAQTGAGLRSVAALTNPAPATAEN